MKLGALYMRSEFEPEIIGCAGEGYHRSELLCFMPRRILWALTQGHGIMGVSLLPSELPHSPEETKPAQ